MPTKMWFGTEQRMQWVPAPATGMQADAVGLGSESTLDDGRKSVYRKMQTHQEFAMNFPVQEAAGLEGLDVFKKFANGFYGDCDTYPIFFADPMHYDQNLMPPGWAAPGLYKRGWPSIAENASRTYFNLALNPSVEVNANNYSTVAGTGGTASGARTLIGTAAIAGKYTYRATWTVATSAVSGGIDYAGTPVLPGTVYDFAVYVRCSKIQRVLITVNWKDNTNVSVGTTVGTQTVLAATTQTPLTISAATAPASAATATIELRAVSGTSGSNWANGNWLEMDAVHISFDSSEYLGGYFDGDTPGAQWQGTAHGSQSYMFVQRIAPTTSDTPANSFNLPPTQATFNIVSSPNAYPTAAGTLGEIPYALIPIPPTHTLHIGACGSATGTAQIVVMAYNTPSVESSPVSTTVLTLLSSTGSTRMNASISGSTAQFVKIFLRRTSTAASTITLSSIMAQLWPTGTSPALTGDFIEGKGHRGLKFGPDGAVATTYALVDPNRPSTMRHLKGLSTVLIEAQDKG